LQALKLNDEQMETYYYLHTDDTVADDTMEAGIEINWIESKEMQDEEWYWIWA
jgi:hypothetical protein